MRRLIVSTFASLDGIMQAPGGPEEDPTGGFTLGGWMFNYWDESVDISASGFDGKDRTWCLVAGPMRYSKRTGLISRMTIRLRRRSMQRKACCFAHINDSSLEQIDPAPRRCRLCNHRSQDQPGPDLQIIGSGNLIQTLQAASLIDEYNVWTFPVVLGRGKRLFGETAKPTALRLVRSQVSTTAL